MNENTNQIQKFQFNESEINTITIDGNPYFVAKNVCDVLGIQDTSNAVKDFEEAEKLTRTIYVSGQNRNILLVSESGLYRLIFQSRKPEAKTFQKWVTSEVLPTIRKTGQYGKQLSIEEQTLNVLTHFQETVKALETKIETDRPKVEFYDELINSDEDFLLREVVKMKNWKIGQNRLFSFLRQKGVLMSGGNNEPYQPYIDKGYFRYIPVSEWKDQNGRKHMRFQTYITGKGIIWLEGILSEEFPEAI